MTHFNVLAPQLASLLSHQSISSPFQFDFILYPDLNAEPMNTVKECSETTIL